jgi:T5SS/PEP-CTERM-associated repeat protein
VQNDGEIGVGQFAGGPGLLEITGGGTLTTGGQFDVIGNQPDSQGEATIDGAGSSWQSAGYVDIGFEGTGILQISTGGSFDAASGLAVGYESSGTLTIESDGTVTSGNTLYDSVGGGTGGAGVVTIDGADALWASNGPLSIGNLGTGDVAVSGGTLIVSSGGSVAPTGLEVGGYGTNGVNGGTGTLAIQSSGTVESGGTLDFIGNGAGSQGKVSVDGTGSTWKAAGMLIIGNRGDGQLTITHNADVDADGPVSLGVLAAGSGTLIVESGGTLSSGGTAYEAIGNAAGSMGEVTIEGSGALWTSNGPLSIGTAGTGDVTVTGGTLVASSGGAVTPTGLEIGGYGTNGLNGGTGTLTVDQAATVESDGSLDIIGNAVGSDGTVVVDGAGSLWKSEGQILVGNQGSGELSVSDGGSLSVAGAVDIGSGAGGTGTATVMTGATVTSAGTYAFVGQVSGSTGIVSIEGTAALWSMSSQLTVGNQGTGTVTVNQGTLIVSSAGPIPGTTGIEVGGYGNGVGGGDGKLTVLGGGTVESDGSLDFIGHISDGSVTVDGAGSLWKSEGQLIVGNKGSGRLPSATAAVLLSPEGCYFRQITQPSLHSRLTASQRWRSAEPPMRSRVRSLLMTSHRSWAEAASSEPLRIMERSARPKETWSSAAMLTEPALWTWARMRRWRSRAHCPMRYPTTLSAMACSSSTPLCLRQIP